MPIKTVVLHVGMHKTGTTSIQQSLGGFDDGRTAYADLRHLRGRQVNHGYGLTAMFRADPRPFGIHQRMGRSAAAMASIRRAWLRKLDAALALEREQLILSGEAIAMLKEPELQALRDHLLRHAERVRVIAYVREPVGYISSMYQQHIKMGQRRMLTALPAPEYRMKLKKFQRLFGAENVTFRPFDRDRMVGGSTLTDFANQIGITAPADHVLANESYSLDAIRLLWRMLRDHGDLLDAVGHPRPYGLLVAHLGAQIGGPKFKLPAALAARRIDRADVKWMQEQMPDWSLGTPEAAQGEPPALADFMADLGAEGTEGLRALAPRGAADDDVGAQLAALYAHQVRLARPSILRQSALDRIVELTFGCIRK
ncbi:hypothetical protein EU805_15840 [Salipiger sp. IMCC34102]|uniref:hypothetical protein n=1 Tax=Salipiger sp. IMCC34102 TaxID=2510647 RepID=UPI00101BA0E9|nr:hypothetical protein [Salipiger sp. IMCC34102]RYH01067.1 hypothetical protein EU805_15840 [Salipiger sp. IMCC34102]